jgi:anti-sigma factor RsiW
MQLDCSDVREILWPQDRPRSLHPQEELARTHLAACAGCREFFGRDARLGRRLSLLGSGAMETAPEALQGRVRRELRDASPSTSSRRWRAWRSEVLAAAAAVTLLAGGLTLSQHFRDLTGPEKFAKDYRRTAVAQVVQPGLDPEAVTLFYERELGLRIQPVSLTEAKLSRATVCLLEGEKGSMVEYDYGGARLAHYRIPEQPEDRAVSSGIELRSRNGVQVVLWHDGAFEHALVSEIPQARLGRLAEESFVGR